MHCVGAKQPHSRVSSVKGKCCAQVRLWNTDTGHCAQVYKHQNNQVSSCAWQPDSRRFVVGTVDRCASQFSQRFSSSVML
jgi:WD40 repeat protein